MTAEDVLNGMPKGHPLNLEGAEANPVYFRSARFSPHSESVLVIVADRAGGLIAVDPEELSFIEDGS